MFFNATLVVLVYLHGLEPTSVLKGGSRQVMFNSNAEGGLGSKRHVKDVDAITGSKGRLTGAGGQLSKGDSRRR